MDATPAGVDGAVPVGVGVPVSVDEPASVGVGVPGSVAVAVSVGVDLVLMVGDSVLAVGVGARVGAGLIAGSTPAALLPGRLMAGVGSIPMGPVPGPVSTWAEERGLDG